MQDLLQILFGYVCGQNPEHTWAPGGLALPCCQRCTGLYAGAFFAALLHLWKRPGLTGRFLEVHGLMLVLMLPFGFHWVDQGPVLRGISGVLFGAGVFTFLWLPVRQIGCGLKTGLRPSARVVYAAGLTLAAAGVPALGEHGGFLGNRLLLVLTAGGAVALALAAATAVFLCLACLRRPIAAHE